MRCQDCGANLGPTDECSRCGYVAPDLMRRPEPDPPSPARRRRKNRVPGATRPPRRAGLAAPLSPEQLAVQRAGIAAARAALNAEPSSTTRTPTTRQNLARAQAEGGRKARAVAGEVLAEIEAARRRFELELDHPPPGPPAPGVTDVRPDPDLL